MSLGVIQEAPRALPAENLAGPRIARLDIYRGCAIILVALGHVIQTQVADFDHNFLFKAIYIFHMPLFFYISGMVANLSAKKRNISSFIGMRALNLLLPFFCWYVVNFLFLQKADANLWDRLQVLYLAPDNGLWFLWVLFWCSALFEVSKYFSTKTNLPRYVFTIALFFLIAAVNLKIRVLGVGLLFMYFPFFCAGALHQEIVKRCERWKWIFAGFALLAFPFVVSFWQRNEMLHIGTVLTEKYHFPISNLLSPLYTFTGFILNALCAVIGIVLFFHILALVFSMKYAFIKQWSAILVFIGVRTLEIYAIQFFFVGTSFAFKSQTVDFVLSAICAIALSIAISELMIRPVPLFSLLLLGRWKINRDR
jgi:fucose 4-O-acetylase-like acetyltransferase